MQNNGSTISQILNHHTSNSRLGQKKKIIRKEKLDCRTKFWWGIGLPRTKEKKQWKGKPCRTKTLTLGKRKKKKRKNPNQHLQPATRAMSEMLSPINSSFQVSVTFDQFNFNLFSGIICCSSIYLQ